MVTNTAKKEVHPEWTMGGNPKAIEDQEIRGRNELLSGDELPRFYLEGGEFVTAFKKYQKLGITAYRKSGDDLFYHVTLPDGWSIIRTDHSMYTELIDEMGRVILSIFYKAAFYDRKAHVFFRDKLERSRHL